MQRRFCTHCARGLALRDTAMPLSYDTNTLRSRPGQSLTGLALQHNAALRTQLRSRSGQGFGVALEWLWLVKGLPG